LARDRERWSTVGGKKEWAKSTNGPDWTDLEAMMRAMQALHSGHVALIVSPNGTGFGTGVDIAASMLFERLPGSSLPEGVGCHVGWPNRTSATLEGACYKLLHELDYAISQVYQQESLWE
jgi:hypothetical protein